MIVREVGISDAKKFANLIQHVEETSQYNASFVVSENFGTMADPNSCQYGYGIF